MTACPLCGAGLSPVRRPYWRCPSCGFYFAVRAGRAGPPMSKLPEGVEEVRESWEEELMKKGWTKEGIEWLKNRKEVRSFLSSLEASRGRTLV